MRHNLGYQVSTTKVLNTSELTQQLSEAGATIEALLAGQIDALIDSQNKTPVLLAKAQEELRASEARFRQLWESGIILTRVAALTADVAMALTHEHTLRTTLEQCTEAIVNHLGIAFARIWTLDSKTKMLELQASAGIPLRFDGPHARVPIGQMKIGRIAETQRPYLTNDVFRDSHAGDPVWDGITAFAGHPLLVNDELVGVLAIFASEPISFPVFKGLGTISDALAVGIQRKLVTSTNAALESQLRQSQKMEAVGRLAGGIAHDFNNILSVILTCSEFLLDGLKPADPARIDAEEICKAGKRAADLTRQLLMFSRQQVLEPKIIDLAMITTNMESMLRRILRENCEFFLRTDEQLGRVRVDPGCIEQVIMNLVVNARDAMPEGGKLTIDIRNEVTDENFMREQQIGAKAGRYVVLSVTDTGTGMDEATQTQIFEPFFTTKEIGKGTGLGLPTVFGIVHQSNGAIRVQSELGKGTTFSIYLPQIDAAPDAQASQPKAAPGGTESILLVEDEEPVRRVARTILQKHGYCVIEMPTAADALAYCQSHPEPIHLLLTDVVMPKMGGPELARLLMKSRPQIKVLCMSGHPDDSMFHQGVMQAGIAFLPKPFTSASLATKVREVLDSTGLLLACM